jgi:hypothetical protein
MIWLCTVRTRGPFGQSKQTVDVKLGEQVMMIATASCLLSEQLEEEQESVYLSHLESLLVNGRIIGDGEHGEQATGLQHAHLYHPTQWSLYHSWTWFSSSNMSNLWPVRMGPISSLFLMCKSIPLKAVPSLWSYHCSIDEPISCLSYTRQNYYMPQHNLSIFGWQAAGVHSRNTQQSSSWTDTSVWTNLFYDLCDVVKPCNWVEVMGMLCAQPQKGDMSLPFISDLSLKWTLYQEQKWQPGNCKSTKECMCILWKNS